MVELLLPGILLEYTGQAERRFGMPIKNKRLYIPLGLICLTLSVLLGRLGEGIIPRVAFIEGVFIGLSLVFGVVGLFSSLGVRSHE